MHISYIWLHGRVHRLLRKISQKETHVDTHAHINTYSCRHTQAHIVTHAYTSAALYQLRFAGMLSWCLHFWFRSVVICFSFDVLFLSTRSSITRPVRPNPAEPARPSESGRTRIWDGRPNPAELGFGTSVRIRPNSDLGRPPESGRTQIGDDRPNPAEKHCRNHSFD